MALICDTGAIYAIYDADDEHHSSAKDVIESERRPLLIPVLLLAEIDYLLSSRLGVDATLDFLTSVQLGAFEIVEYSRADLLRCGELIRQCRDLEIGLADASVVAAAERLKIPRLFTFDQRHFRTILPRGFSHFEILPADLK